MICSNRDTTNQEAQTKRDNSGSASDSEHSQEDDDDIPAFLTCDICSLVLIDFGQALAHEKRCAINGVTVFGDTDRLFSDKDLLIQFLLDFSLKEGRYIGERDRVYYRRDQKGRQNSGSHPHL